MAERLAELKQRAKALGIAAVYVNDNYGRWRSDFKSDGATRFNEVAGGLNQMTVRKFVNLVAASDFDIEQFRAVPIARLRRLSNPLTRELFTSTVRCRLVPRPAAAVAAAQNLNPRLMDIQFRSREAALGSLKDDIERIVTAKGDELPSRKRLLSFLDVIARERAVRGRAR